jgi:hypothetical protein
MVSQLSSWRGSSIEHSLCARLPAIKWWLNDKPSSLRGKSYFIFYCSTQRVLGHHSPYKFERLYWVRSSAILEYSVRVLYAMGSDPFFVIRIWNTRGLGVLYSLSRLWSGQESFRTVFWKPLPWKMKNHWEVSQNRTPPRYLPSTVKQAVHPPLWPIRRAACYA